MNEKMYYSTLSYYDKYAKNNEEYTELAEKYLEMYKKITDMLGEDKVFLDNMLDIRDDMEAIIDLERFRVGYVLGYARTDECVDDQ